MDNENQEAAADDGQAAVELQQEQQPEQLPSNPASPDDRQYAMRILVKQGRLVGEERALELPEAQRAEAVEAVLVAAKRAFAGLTDEQFQQFVDAGRAGRVAVCRELLGL
jgi:hypothetical protein